jgi:hypothetical protein
MFLGLLDRVKFDLVRTHLQYIIWSPINRQQRPMGETGQVSAHL